MEGWAASLVASRTVDAARVCRKPCCLAPARLGNQQFWVQVHAFADACTAQVAGHAKPGHAARAADSLPALIGLLSCALDVLAAHPLQVACTALPAAGRPGPCPIGGLRTG